jgi:hypothetical protein
VTHGQDERGAPGRHRLVARPAYRLLRTGLLMAFVIVVALVLLTGSGTEDQSGLLVSLILVLVAFGAVGLAVAVSAWRLELCLSGSCLRVQGLRRRSVDLRDVERVSIRSRMLGGPSLRFGTADEGPESGAALGFPLSSYATIELVVVPAWDVEELGAFLRQCFDQLGERVTFDSGAARLFIDAGCPLDEQ